jgi:hypothetical protein
MDIGYYLTLLFYYLIYGIVPSIVVILIATWLLDDDSFAIKDVPKYKLIIVFIFFGFVMDMLGLI